MYKIGDIITVQITEIEHYGFFFKTSSNYKGLVHISEVSEKYIYDINDFLKIGQKVEIEVLNCDEKKKQIEGSYKKANLDDESQTKEIFDTVSQFEILEEKIPKMVKEKIKEINIKGKRKDD